MCLCVLIRKVHLTTRIYDIVLLTFIDFTTINSLKEEKKRSRQLQKKEMKMRIWLISLCVKSYNIMYTYIIFKI